MAAKSKKRLSKIENKIIKLEDLEIKDVLCSICQSILVKPVTLPCFHGFCQSCFNGSVENNALCCPLCRLRIGSWLRTATKQKNLVNEDLWKYIQSKFPHEIDRKIKGEDIHLPEEKPVLRLSAPGEIRREYEAELSRLRKERLQLEEKHIEETELLIKTIQEEEEEAHKKYLEALKKDEIIAKQMQKQLLKYSAPPNTPQTLRSTKPRFKNNKIDGYLSKNKPVVPPTTVENSPLLTDDNTSTDCSTPRAPANRMVNGGSPEMTPSYGKIIKSLIEKKNKIVPGLWNKENGDRVKDKKEDLKIITKKSIDTEDSINNIKHKNGIPSLLVSLPLPCAGLLHHKANLLETRKGADSVDSMRQELCYFKPIDEVSSTSSSNKRLPLRVPGVRPPQSPPSPLYEPTPSRAQYLDSLCNLRQISLAKKLPSAFVIALNILRVYRKENPTKNEVRVGSRLKKRKSTSPCAVPPVPIRRNPNRNKQTVQINGITKLNNKTNRRRTRSMGSVISKDENETTPKKAKTKCRKAVSDKKPYLRSDSKKSAKKDIESPPLHSGAFNNNKVNLAVKNLSSPFENCDVKHILHEQLRIEKLIEQEKIDHDLACKIEEEWNRRQPRRAAMKRQVTLNYALKPAKKLKV